MKSIQDQAIIDAVSQLCIDINYQLGQDVVEALRRALDQETEPIAKQMLNQILENARIAAKGEYPLCQDTGLVMVFVKMGQSIHVKGMPLPYCIEEGVRRGYSQGFLRKSIVCDPFQRINTDDNTPPILYTDVVPGQELRIVLMAKGGGSENMGATRMLRPADGRSGVVEFVVDTVRKAGGNACPPLVVGVGLGGTMDACCVAAKKALFRPLGSFHHEPYYQELEEELKSRINQLGIGPMGLGGRITALAVHVHALPCHIASLPVAVSLNCHSHRHGRIVL